MNRVFANSYTKIKDITAMIQSAPDMTADQKHFLLQRLQALPLYDVAPVVTLYSAITIPGHIEGAYGAKTSEFRKFAIREAIQKIGPQLFAGGFVRPREDRSGRDPIIILETRAEKLEKENHNNEFVD